MNNLDNPILSNERHTYKDNEKDQSSLYNINHDQLLSTKNTISSILYNFLSFIKSYIFSIIIKQDQIQDKTFSTQSIESDSDLEYVKTEYVYSNDFHILNKTNNNNNNSILQDSTIEISQEPNQPKQLQPSQSTSEILRQYLKTQKQRQIQSDHQNDNSYQYGTDLSIATKINNYHANNNHQQLIKLEPHNETLLDLPSQDSKPTTYQQSILNYYIPTKPMSINQYSLLDNVISNFYIDKISSIYEKTSNNLQNIITKKRLDDLKVITPLDDSQLSKIYSIWNGPQKLHTDNYSVEITTNDLNTLKDGRWLNDNIIDYYLNLIMKQNSNVFAWTTHFYTSLAQKGYSGVARWAKRKKVDLIKKEKILVPVNISNTHWALSVIDNVEKTIIYYDSLVTKNGNPQAIKNLNEYMKQEANRLGHEPIDYELIPFVKTPQQNNGSDCGVFTCTAAKFISQNKQLEYSQKDMKNIRRRMVWEILQNDLLD